MSETADWKQKYRDSLVEMEADEKRWRHVEQVLRRLVGRLCAAGMGVNSQLDDELRTLAAANRRNADADELARLSANLTTTVIAVDATYPVLPILVTPPGTDRTLRIALAAVIKKLLADLRDPATLALPGKIAAAPDDEACIAIVTQAADVIQARNEDFARDRIQAAAALSEVMRRLDEVVTLLTSANDSGRERFDDSNLHNDFVLSQVRELSVEVSSVTDTSALRERVNARLAQLSQQVSAFKAREADRVLAYDGRAEKMRARIADLEREALELHSKLAKESIDSRVDSLTGIANRKAFEEHFGRLAEGGNAELGSVLLWDIDRFKLINDNFGHRAGDRVLQRVAECLNALLGPNDMLARIGGEEFGMLLQNRSRDDTARLAEQIRAAVAATGFHFRGAPVRVTVSCGFTTLLKGDTTEAAFNRADAALYKAKDCGRNACIAA